jgi:SAM-dependent methyltransferase
MADPCLAAKFHPYRPDLDSYVLWKSRANGAGSGEQPLPVPPPEYWLGYGTAPEEYLRSGQEDVETMKRILRSSSFSLEATRRILEFGCASARMLRWLHDLAGSRELWGVDMIDALVLWCQQHLTPPFRFTTVTNFPHLPFEDNYFDFIYAGSVFTHIPDLDTMWLLELRRVLRPGGRLYVTVHDNQTIAFLFSDTIHTRDPSAGPLADMIRTLEKDRPSLRSDYAKIVCNRVPGAGGPGEAQVFYDRDYLLACWGAFFTVISVTPEAYWCQTAILLEKPVT